MKEFVIIFLTGLFISAFGQSPPLDKNWQIVFDDSFDFFNTNIWTTLHNDDLSESVAVAISQNVYVSNGSLVIATKKETHCCPQNYYYCPKQNKTGECYQYTTGSLWSNTSYKYGYFEIYAKMPASGVLWPAFWLYAQSSDYNNSDYPPNPNAWYNEIDIFEAYGWEQNAVESNTHFGLGNPPTCTNALGALPHTVDYTSGYHWYGIEWYRDKIIWYIDSKRVRQTTNNMCGIGIQNPMKVILDVGLYGTQIPNGMIFPNYMYVDQINIWRLEYDCNTVVNEISNFNTFYYAVKKSITLSGATTIPSNSNISLRAAEYIELTNGFEAPLGAELYLDVNSCENIGIIKKE